MTVPDERDGEADAGASPGVTIIGVDAAADPKNVGLARGVVVDGQLRVLEIGLIARKLGELVERVASWVTPPTLLAIDAPLGWPRALGLGLSRHCGEGNGGSQLERGIRLERDR